jgi:hypothetical protein
MQEICSKGDGNFGQLQKRRQRSLKKETRIAQVTIKQANDMASHLDLEVVSDPLSDCFANC